MEQLISYIEQFGSLTAYDKELLQQSFSRVSLKKGDYFVEAGRVCSTLGFIQEGIFRSCYYDRQGNDFTRYFIYEGRFVGDINGFLDKVNSLEYIEAITDGEVWVLTREKFNTVQSHIPGWYGIFSKINSYVLENKLKMASNMLSQDGQTRYENFLTHYPGLCNRIPQSILASYLGVTPSSLSRIRRSIK
ncbi:Crp/Fnr family transcriptional regulator [Sphingobacterium sp. LRF_L2]|uniref:Crp/Fnr family transcriptional regulator n=1 Tax=Sphingobacterium sp. LRF_L2 TaxID=3369421 RepID=UPI003F5ED285